METVPTIGQPTKLTPKVQETILQSIRNGAYIVQACVAAGVGESTFYDWVKWGNEGRSPYSEFSEALKEAEATIENEMAAVIVNAARDKAFLPAIIFNERRFSRRWGRTVQIEADEDARELLTRLREIGKPPEIHPGEVIEGTVLSVDGAPGPETRPDTPQD